MARIEEIERRLLNWARCRLGGGGSLGYASVELGAESIGQREGYREARIPINDCEADETEAGIVALPGELRATVVRVYTGPGGQEDHMRWLCITSITTLKARIDRAHRMLDRWFADKQAAALAERERVERLGRGFYT